MTRRAFFDAESVGLPNGLSGSVTHLPEGGSGCILELPSKAIFPECESDFPGRGLPGDQRWKRAETILATCS